MTCNPIPISQEQKKLWIDFLELVAKSLDGQKEIKTENKVFAAREGDVHIGKLLAGTLLATLKNEVVTIK